MKEKFYKICRGVLEIFVNKNLSSKKAIFQSNRYLITDNIQLRIRDTITFLEVV